MNNIGKLFTQTIKKCYLMEREGKEWILENGFPIKLRSPDKQSCGFSLDHKAKPPFLFFTGCPPAHIAKMCDATIALSYQGKEYIFLIEKKTKHKGDYRFQLINGKHFCDWVVALFKSHGHYSQTIHYTALLVWSPRKSPNKESSTHQAAKQNKPPETLTPYFSYYHSIQNQTLIRLVDYLH